MVGLDELLRESDIITVHLPKTPETVGLIGERELGLVKPGVIIVNAARGGLIDEDALAAGLPSRIEVEVRGEIAQYDVKVLELAVLKGIFTDVVEKSVTYVNAPLLAQDRGVEVSLITDEDGSEYRNLITVHGTLPTGLQLSVAGTLAGPRFVEKLVKVDDFDVDLTLSEHFGFFRYEDRPGIVGIVGQILGEHGINIAGMQVARAVKGGDALVALTVDSAIPVQLIDTITERIGARSGRAVDLVEV
jgi:D-3-phosphoglycerate dehydrogenase